MNNRPVRAEEMMSYTDTIFDIILKLFGFIFDGARILIRKAGELAVKSWEWISELPLLEKLIVLNSVPAVISVMLPVAKFEIWDSYYEINNPLSHYMVLIGLMMFVSIFIRHRRFVPLVRIGVNIYYFGWVVFCYFAPGQITKTTEPFVILPIYYLNFVVPLIYAGLSYLSYSRER
jgi:hypothetical protein